ncbi:DNA polymerase III subunit beta [Cohnella sp. AR92]|uniref:DNA polymerase III subunit beta n=1 Tax=Cohnella sp. AR92 TaxID=648716 RepID=UPI00131508D2|nr:DNA polymerase III subunit beta [Cohnella sp. AR92]
MATAVKTKSGIKIVVKDPSRFKDKVVQVADACPDSNALPLLTCMKIEVRAGSVVFTGGDGINTICVGEQDVVEADQDASFVVPAALFSSIIKKLPAGKVELTKKDGESLLIKAGSAKFDLSLFNGDEFPQIPTDKNVESEFKIPASSLVAGLKSTMYAAAEESKQESKNMPVLTGVNMEMAAGETNLKFTGTDRNRLSRFLVEGIQAQPFRQTIAVSSCKEIVKIIDSVQQEVKVTVTQSVISITGPGFMIVSKFLEGNYPDTDKVIPRKFEMEVVLEREKLLAVLTRTSVFAKTKKMGIFTLKDDQMSIFSKTEIGQVAEGLDCQTVGKEMRLGLDVFFLIDAIKAVDHKEIRLSFTSPTTPVAIRPDNETNKVIGVIIPIRLN